MRAKVDIFSGFLGAGKTTLIKKLISESLYKEKVVIIENEFGEIGIDGSILKSTNIEVKEINAGCICCNISGDFKKAVKEVVAKYSPERIIIEPTGVAKLSDLLTACSSIELKSIIELNMVVTVVDVLKYDMYLANFGEFYRNQIMSSSIIVLSRTQNLEADKIESIKEKVEKLNNKACIVTTPWNKLAAQRIVELNHNNTKLSLQNEVNLIRRSLGTASMKSVKNHAGNEIFETWSYETPRRFSEKALVNLLKKIDSSSFGNILRAKGIVQGDNDEWMQFDYVPGEFEMRKTSPDYSGRLCVIGTNLNRENLKKVFSL
ncbi:GTP-binding protein [Clostridium swellfunianum]|uniref:CobW family GTP-binding protein n=1 Tax=Clostridium swellfunianum TaxID=1367462 RepID=UPI00202E2DFA|nr:GTP-binding protein [Clostridium swellfunianum]MCM0649329.1 GTP-binding protein [Clostridium swellfunianum]